MSIFAGGAAVLRVRCTTSCTKCDAMRIMNMDVMFSPHHGVYNKRIVTRTWKERLFEYPWQPFKKTRIALEFEPTIHIVDLPKMNYSGLYIPAKQMILAHSSYEKDIKNFAEELNIKAS